MKKNRKQLPYKGTLVHNMPKDVCFTCEHYGCTDSIECQCMGLEKSGRIRMMFRRLLTGNKFKESH